jgi:amidase
MTSSSSRRHFLRTSGLVAAGMSLGPLLNGCATGGAPKTTAGSINVEEITVAEVQAAMQSGRLTSVLLVEIYLERIQAMDRTGPALRAVEEINPDALAIARSLDEERKAGKLRGPMHGIPVLLKNNIATADKMETTAGALALVGAKPREDSTIAAKMRAAGIVILGKASLSEWAYFKSAPGSSGWSGRSGQAKNPYALDRTPCGSSSGSAIAVAANLVTVSIGTETDGSIICPAGVNGVVGIKPTVGLTSRAGVIPISATQDTIGPFGRTVADAAALLGAMTGVDPRDAATQASAGKSQTDYTQFLTPGGLKGVRIGVPRDGYYGYSQKSDATANAAIAVMREQGAVIVDPVKIPNFDRAALTAAELIVFQYELKAGVNAYLASVQPGGKVRTLEDVIEFNKQYPAENMPYFNQEWLERSQAKGGLNEPEYLEALAKCKRLGGTEGFDVIMEQEKLDVLVAPTTTPAWTVDLVNGDTFRGSSAKSAALVGYPLISVPSGFTMGLPLGVTFMGRAWSEPKLITIAYAYEQATKARKPPQYRATSP